MSRRPKDIGTAAESAVVGYLRSAGFPHAERRALAGVEDAGDIAGTPGIVWEVKAGQQTRGEQAGAVERWLGETERERGWAGAEVGVLVMQRHGFGSTRISWWWAVVILEQVDGVGYDSGTKGTPAWLRLGDAASLLRRRGYGHPFIPGTERGLGAIPAGCGGEPSA